MPREEIQKANPGGVSNRPARTDEHLPPEFDCAPPAFGNRLLLPRWNVAALLSAVCGAFALLLTFGGYLVATGSSRWADSLHSLVPPAFWIGGLLGIVAFLLGLGGVARRLENPGEGGLLWACAGLVAGCLSVVMIVGTFVQVMMSIEC